MYKSKKINLRYLVDKDGKKQEVVLPLKEFEELLEDLADLAVVAERRDEESIPHKEVLKTMKANGLL